MIKLLQNFDVDVLLYDPFVTDEKCAEMGCKKVDFETLLKESDIVSIHAPSIPATNHMFNAETFIVGLAAGLVGILITEILLIPTNILIQEVAELDASAVLVPLAAVILVVISVGLTLIAGLIPSRNAANKDPVVALRSE